YVNIFMVFTQNPHRTVYILMFSSVEIFGIQCFGRGNEDFGIDQYGTENRLLRFHVMRHLLMYIQNQSLLYSLLFNDMNLDDRCHFLMEFDFQLVVAKALQRLRSEERRVGKE